MRFSQYLVLLTREPVSFWQKNVIAVVILLQVLVRMWWENVIKCKRIYNFAIGRGLHLLQYKYYNCTDFFGEKK